MKPLLCLLALFAAAIASAQGTSPQAPAKAPPTTPILRIEAGAHTAAIKSIAVNLKGRFVATCSMDKAVRIWELPSLRFLRVLRLPLGTIAKEGQLNALALLPGGGSVAVGGWTGKQHPTIQKRPTVRDFPIAVAGGRP